MVRYKLLSILLMILGMGLSGLSFAHAHTMVKHLPSKSIDINHADAKQFTRLSGIGVKKSLAIIAYRKKYGPFHSINDMEKVKGISHTLIQRILKNNPGRLIINPRH